VTLTEAGCRSRGELRRLHLLQQLLQQAKHTMLINLDIRLLFNHTAAAASAAAAAAADQLLTALQAVLQPLSPLQQLLLLLLLLCI
jgi:hypothetical protein